MGSLGKCKHNPSTPFRGMQLVGITDEDFVTFQCPICGALHDARRCAALSPTTGFRCRNAVVRTADFCIRHVGGRATTPAVAS